jgi:multiple sugar transport system ATP-binding protein
MNLLEGRIERGNGVPRIALAEGHRIDLPPGVPASEGQRVLFGIRPEHLALAGDGLPADVIVVEPTGADTQLYCEVGGADVNVVLRDRTETRAGDRVRLAPDLTKFHLFDAASGRRIGTT